MCFGLDSGPWGAFWAIRGRGNHLERRGGKRKLLSTAVVPERVCLSLSPLLVGRGLPNCLQADEHHSLLLTCIFYVRRGSAPQKTACLDETLRVETSEAEVEHLRRKGMVGWVGRSIHITLCGPKYACVGSITAKGQGVAVVSHTEVPPDAGF